MPFETRYQAIVRIKEILKEYVNFPEKRLGLYKNVSSLRDIFDFFNSADSYFFMLPDNEHVFSNTIGMNILAWDVYDHPTQSLGFILGGKGRMKLEDVRTISSVQYLIGRHLTSLQPLKISNKTHLILIKAPDRELDRIDIDNIIKNIDFWTANPLTLSSESPSSQDSK